MLAATGPVHASPGTALAKVETITILPIVFSQSIAVEDLDELQHNVDKMLLRKLALKGYVLERPRRWVAPEPWTVEALKPMAPQALAALAPAHASYAALLFVERLAESGNAVASSASVVISARIVDTAGGRTVWQAGGDAAHSEHALQGLLFGPGPLTMMAVMAFTPDKYFALEKAFDGLFEGLPERP